MEERFSYIAAAYDSHAESEFHVGTIGHLEPRYFSLKKIISDFKSDIDSFIDVGGGSGILALWLAALGHKVSLIDISGRCIEYAKMQASLTSASENLSFYNLAAEHLSADNAIAKASFALCLGPTHHADTIESIYLIINGLKRKFIDDGYVLISFINGLNLASGLLASDSLSEVKSGIINCQQLKACGFFVAKKESNGLHTFGCTPEKCKEILDSSGLEVIDKYGFDSILNGVNWELAKSRLSTSDFHRLRETLVQSCKSEDYFDKSSILCFICKKATSKTP